MRADRTHAEQLALWNLADVGTSGIVHVLDLEELESDLKAVGKRIARRRHAGFIRVRVWIEPDPTAKQPLDPAVKASIADEIMKAERPWAVRIADA